MMPDPHRAEVDLPEATFHRTAMRDGLSGRAASLLAGELLQEDPPTPVMLRLLLRFFPQLDERPQAATIIPKLMMPGPHRTKVKPNLALLHVDALRHYATKDTHTDWPASHQHVSAYLGKAFRHPCKAQGHASHRPPPLPILRSLTM